jgi:hypothetical protein
MAHMTREPSQRFWWTQCQQAGHLAQPHNTVILLPPRRCENREHPQLTGGRHKRGAEACKWRIGASGCVPEPRVRLLVPASAPSFQSSSANSSSASSSSPRATSSCPSCTLASSATSRSPIYSLVPYSSVESMSMAAAWASCSSAYCNCLAIAGLEQ